MTIIEARTTLANPWGNEPAADAFYERAPGQITDAEIRKEAGALLIEVAARAKALAAYITDQRRPFAEAAKKITDHFANDTAALAELEATLKRQIGGWDAEQARLAEQRRREEEQRQREEQARLDDEARRQREALEAAAVRLDEKGATDAAVQLLDRAATVQPAVAPRVAFHPESKAMKGSTRMVWKARITNPALVPDAYKTIDVAALERVAAATKGQQAVPGVEWHQVPQVSAR